MVSCQSANQLKTPAKDSWVFKMVSQFGSLGYTIMGKTADLTVVQKTIIDTLQKEGKPQTFIAKEAVHRVLYPSMLTESWVEGKSVEEKVAPLCFLKTNVTAPIYQDILEHFMLPSADQLFKDADFIFQQDLAPAHTAKSTRSWLNDHGVTVLDWPVNSPDLNPRENLWGIVKRKMSNKRPKNADELKATVKETWASIPPQQCHKLITSMPRRIEAVIKAKGAPTKYWVQIQYMNILSRRPTIH